MKRHRIRSGFTLIETLLAVAVTAICSVAVYSLLTGALNADQYLQSSNTSVSETEMAVLRIMHNLRAATFLNFPVDLNPQTSVSIVTQSDPAYGNVGATVTYSLVGTNLQEIDSRYGTNIIAHNVKSFSVTLLSIYSPTNLQVSITINGAPPLTRQFKVYCRNL